MESVNTQDPIPNLLTDQSHNLEAVYDEVNFPNLVTRIKALFVDMVIVLLIFIATTLVVNSVGDVHDFVKGSIFVFMLYLYDPLFTSLTGSTPGHKVMGLKVRRYRDPEKKISIGQAFFRFLMKGLLGWISFLTVTGNKHKRAIHDLASGSIVLPVSRD